MNRQERTEMNIKEIEASFGYWLMKTGFLYVFFIIWHLFTQISVQSCLLFLRIYIWGFENRSEELGMKDYIKQMGKLKLFFVILMTVSLNCMFLWSERTRLIYFQTIIVYYTMVFLIKVRGINIMEWIHEKNWF